MKIQIVPYNQIENQTFINDEFLITNDLFDAIECQEGKSTFSFLNCRFNKLTIKNTSNIDFKDVLISFSYCQIQEIEISEIESKNVGIHCHGCIIEGRIKNGNLKSVGLNNCFTPSLFLLNQNNVNISYTEENVFVKSWKRVIEGMDIKSIKDLLAIKQNINIYHSKNIRFSFNHNRTGKTGIYRDKYSQIDEWKIRYYLTEEQKKSLIINVSVDFSNQQDELLKIENCMLNALSLTGNANGKISIENSSINNLFIRDFSSESDTLLYNIHPVLNESKLEVHKSNMDNTWFDNIDFNGYKSLSFYRTRLAKAAFTSCNFPEDNLSFDKFKTLENIHYPDIKPENYYKDQYETFLQLKKSLEDSGNYYEAQKIGAISKESLRKISTLSKWDKFILWTYAKSNNHGLSIKKPLIGLFGFSIIFYVLYLLSIGRIFNSNEIDWILVGHYFSFMDLTHRQDFLVSKEEYSFWTLTIDFSNKLIVGFFLFQFVSAFRKYVKK
jgi:hypothetical protein